MSKRSVNLQRRAPRDAGAVERARSALARRGGVHATNYVLHVPLTFASPLTGTFTYCGRRAVDVNCVGNGEEATQLVAVSHENELCKRCKAAIRAVDALRAAGGKGR